ncbi:efflux RND transporter permease subunit [bacterium]|nr:MAG: efflux RND transporter permease subunit [bacterium]
MRLLGRRTPNGTLSRRPALHFSLPRFAIEHPHFTIVVALLMVALGLYSYATIPSRMVPKVPSPDIGIVTQFPGMSAEDMERYITRPLEKRIQIAGGMDYELGVSQPGYSKIVVYFHQGVDLQQKWGQMQALLNTVSNELPQAGPNLTLPRLVHVNTQNSPAIQFAITRPGESRTGLKQLVDNVVLTQFQKIPGVLAASTFGGPERHVQIIVDRDKLAAYRIPILAIRNAIDAADFNHGGGPLLNGDKTIEVDVNNELTASDILQRLPRLPIAAHDGRVIYLGDIAHVTDAHAHMYGDFFFNGQPAIWLGVQAKNETNYLDVIKHSKALAAQMESEYPGLKAQIVFDQSFYIGLDDKNALHEFFLAVILASLVMFLFLGEAGGTLIAAAILPSAVAFGFFLIKNLGVQRDFGIMLGMVFVVGKLLDDSIVVVESIRRHIERGIHPRTAAVLGAEQVQQAITAATFTFVVMLFPMTRLTGDMGAGFFSMTVPMITSVIASLYLALTLTPLMAAHLFAAKPGAVEGRESTIEDELTLSDEPPPGEVGRFMYRVLLRHFHRFERFFTRLAGWSLEHSWIVLAAAFGSLIMAGSIYGILGEEQMPLTDTSFVLGYVRATPGTSFNRMKQIVLQIERIAKEHKNVLSVGALTGEAPSWGDYFNGYGVNETNEARLYMKLTVAREQRKRTLWQIDASIVKEAKGTIPDLGVFFLQPLNPTPVVAARAPVEVLVKGPDLDQVYQYGRQVEQMAHTDAQGLHDPYLDIVRGVPQYRIDVDEARARALGLTVQDVVGQVYYAVNGGFTGAFFNPGINYHSRILIRYRADQRATKANLAHVLIATPSGEEVPLESVASIHQAIGYNRIHTYDTLYAASVLGYYQELGLKETTMSLLVPAKMQIAMPKGYSIGPAGLMGTMLTAFNQLNTGLQVALIAVFLLLTVQFRSFGIALVLMLAIPLEGVGSLGALWIRDMKWSPPVLWGMVLLAGIVLSNSILLVDKILHLRSLGVERTKAIVSASALRLRPVLMTAIAAGIAMFPVAIKPPPATEQFRNIATAITGGLVTSTLMTLLVIPAAYLVMDSFMTWLRAFYLDERFSLQHARPDVAPTPAQEPETAPR